MRFQDLYTSAFFAQVATLAAQQHNRIIVLQGQLELLQLDGQQDAMADAATFLQDGGEELFDKQWFARAFVALSTPKPYHLLSFAQLSYLLHHLNPDFFADRVAIVRDNLRTLFPVFLPTCMAQDGQEAEQRQGEVAERPDNMPIYCADPRLVDGRCHAAIKWPAYKFQVVDAFQETLSLTTTAAPQSHHLDVVSDPQAIDQLLDSCMATGDFGVQVLAYYHSKHPRQQEHKAKLEQLNALLTRMGGTLFLEQSQAETQTYQVKPQTEALLRKYWGEHASFRDMWVYAAPNTSKQLKQVSQGEIVELMIGEYERAKAGEDYRDLFLTAPTGAGKSLLFQLPAFHVSAQGDLTIVVSPLIALMKDQVDAVKFSKGFDKVAYLNSELNFLERGQVIESCKSGRIDVLYLSPELLLSYDISHFIGTRKLGLMVIDEAHLITTWGRDFRVDYWFLGNHIRKIRKHNPDMRFPLMAVTATAIYGGDNDMVFDGMDSLQMHNPRVYIGKVKREDIYFLINNHEAFHRDYNKNKLQQTVGFIEQIAAKKRKTLVYVPYKRQITDILKALAERGCDVATGYYGKLDMDAKELAYEKFKSSEKMVMVATKAFGMGVDISDIEVVYHHAPSGLLPDYVQEIGRVARTQGTQGFAALNYAKQDQRFSKALHGMSALRYYQLKGVLEKLSEAYKQQQQRNFLLSVDDFAHIFPNVPKDQLDQKVLTALMMLEKDYLQKVGFNVLIARPKKLFVQVYASLPASEYGNFCAQHPGISTLVHRRGENDGERVVISLELDKLWERHFTHKSFPMLKKEYYEGKLFQQFSLKTQIKAVYGLQESWTLPAADERIKHFFRLLSEVLAQLSGLRPDVNTFFKKEQFVDALSTRLLADGLLKDKKQVERLADFLLETFSNRMLEQGKVEGDAFLARRKQGEEIRYRVSSRKYGAQFGQMERLMSSIFAEGKDGAYVRYLTNTELSLAPYLRLGMLLELLKVGTIKTQGGDHPMVFIRLNDPERIAKDATYKGYKNVLLSQTLQRHELSSQIFDHFFMREFTNAQRWDFIEDFFLGKGIDELLKAYPGSDVPNEMQIVEMIGTRDSEQGSDPDPDFDPPKGGRPVPVEGEAVLPERGTFPMKPETTYYAQNLLTMRTEAGVDETRPISEWISTDPVLLYRTLCKYQSKVARQLYNVLFSKVKVMAPELMREQAGLHSRISFPGYKDGPVQAIRPYKERPVDFYKWWVKHREQVCLGFIEQITLFAKVYECAPKTLQAADRQLLVSRRAA